MYNWIVTHCKIWGHNEKAVTIDIQLPGILSTVMKSGFFLSFNKWWEVSNSFFAGEQNDYICNLDKEFWLQFW